MVKKENQEKEESQEKKEERSKKKKKKLFSSKFLLFYGGISIALLIGSYLLVERVLVPSVSMKENSPGSFNENNFETIIYPFEPIIVNLAGTGAKRYLRVTISLELDNSKVREEIERLSPRLIDSLITFFSSKTLSEIEDAKGKVNLRKEIITQLNAELSTGRIINVYFTEFIIQ